MPWEENLLNAANNLAAMEITLPLQGRARALAPLFPIDAEGTALDHVLADKAFATLAVLALGEGAAKTLSLHRGRGWLATPLTPLD